MTALAADREAWPIREPGDNLVKSLQNCLSKDFPTLPIHFHAGKRDAATISIDAELAISTL
jgi:hypothetical protein